MARPPLASWLKYAYGGALPAYRPWVLHDLTDRGWQLRVLLRLGLQVLPVAILAALVPGIDSLARVLLVALVILSALLTVGISADALRDRRLRQHGFPTGEDPDERYREQRRRY